MAVRHDTWQAVIRLAVLLSAVGAALAVVLEAIGDVSTLALVAVVAVVGFTTSWTLSGRPTEPATVARRTERIHQPAA